MKEDLEKCNRKLLKLIPSRRPKFIKDILNNIQLKLPGASPQEILSSLNIMKQLNLKQKPSLAIIAQWISEQKTPLFSLQSLDNQFPVALEKVAPLLTYLNTRESINEASLRAFIGKMTKLSGVSLDLGSTHSGIFLQDLSTKFADTLETVVIFDSTPRNWQAGLGGHILNFLKSLKNMKSLTVNHSLINLQFLSQIPLDPVRELTISLSGKNSFKNFPDLDKLDTLKFHASFENFEELPTKCPQLKTLAIGGMTVTGEHFDILGQLPHLTSLNLQNAEVSNYSLKFLKKCKQLTALSLVNCKIDDSGVKHLKALNKLEKLYLSGTQITDESLKLLADLKTLKVLHLEICPNITPVGVQALQAKLPDLIVTV